MAESADDFLANTKHLYNICTMLAQRRRRWAGIVQMLYKCFVFAGLMITACLAASVTKSEGPDPSRD